jgi:hypothetical protein
MQLHLLIPRHQQLPVFVQHFHQVDRPACVRVLRRIPCGLMGSDFLIHVRALLFQFHETIGRVLGCRIEVRSRPGKGSVFAIYVPLSLEMPVPISVAAHQVPGTGNPLPGRCVSALAPTAECAAVEQAG